MIFVYLLSGICRGGPGTLWVMSALVKCRDDEKGGHTGPPLHHAAS
jgi:hypothetical protein